MNEPRLSKSKINCYEGCPYRYKLTYVDKIPAPETPEAFIKGRAVHSLLEKFYENCTTLKQAVEKLASNTQAHKYKNELQNFINFNVEMSLDDINLNIPLMVEKTFNDSELNITGIVDAVFKDHKGNIIVLDYKTGNMHDIDDYRFELALYYHLLCKNTEIQPTHWGIYFVDHNELKCEPIKQISITSAKKKVVRIRDKINSNIFPKKSIFCKWCPYYKKHCEGSE